MAVADITPYAPKESRRWLAGAERAGALLDEAASVTMVADRESDIYEEFALRPANVHLLTRAAQDRKLEDGRFLFEAIQSLPEVASYTINVPARGQRPAREAKVNIWTPPVLQGGLRLWKPRVDCTHISGLW